MKISKKRMSGTAFNFFFVFGLVIATNSNAMPPIGIAMGFLIRIGLPVLFGIVGAIFTYRLLEWFEQARSEGTGKTGDND